VLFASFLLSLEVVLFQLIPKAGLLARVGKFSLENGWMVLEGGQDERQTDSRRTVETVFLVLLFAFCFAFVFVLLLCLFWCCVKVASCVFPKSKAGNQQPTQTSARRKKHSEYTPSPEYTYTGWLILVYIT
jgi:hypothetical protein